MNGISTDNIGGSTIQPPLGAEREQSPQKTDQEEEKDINTLLDNEIDTLLNALHKTSLVTAGNYQRVLDLLQDMIGILQQLAMAQSDQMSFATDMQAFYTEWLNNAPVYEKKDISDDNKRSEANRQVELAMEKIRTRRDAMSDKAKKSQASVNALNDSVNQQTSEMLNTLRQQLRELTSLITRGE